MNTGSELIKSELPHIRLGRKILVPKAEFEKWQTQKDSTASTEKGVTEIEQSGKIKDT